MAYYDLYLSNNAKEPHSIYHFYEQEQKASESKTGEWVQCETDEDKADYGGNAVSGATQLRKQFYDFPVENPFVKSAPTNQKFWLVEFKDNLIKIR